MVYDLLISLGVDISQWFLIIYKDGQEEYYPLEDVCLHCGDIRQVITNEGLIFDVLPGPPYLKWNPWARRSYSPAPGGEVA